MRKRIRDTIQAMRMQGTRVKYLVVNCDEWTDNQLACFKVCAREFHLTVQHSPSVPYGEMMLAESKP